VASERRCEFALDPYRAQRDDGEVGCPHVVGECPGRVRAVHVREPEVHEDHVWQLLARYGHAFGAGPGLERPDPGGPQHIAGELQVLLVVVDYQDQRFHGRILPPMAIRVVLAEDHYLVREGIRRLLDTRRDLEVVAVCGDLDSLLAAVEAKRPDVVVTDIRMPPSDTDEGIQAAERLRETNPEIGVVVLSQYASPNYVLALLAGGSAGRGYLLKERVKDLEQLVAAIGAVAEGGSVIDPKVVEALVAENARSEESPLSQLTPRERDVLREMAEGKNNAAIAGELSLTERSVEKVIHSIFLKLGLTWETAVHKRVKAVILYLAESA
jgi:DNA-binding NarL/FixJ family response regulator